MIRRIMSRLGYEKKSDPKIARTPKELEQFLLSIYGGQSSSGIHVTPLRAMQASAVYACLKVISETVAQLPLHLIRRDGEWRQRAAEHALYSRLHDAPNDFQSSFEFREMLTGHTCLRGNAYAFINRLSDGSVAELLPIQPDRVKVEMNSNYELTYEVQNDWGKWEAVPKEKIFHLRGMTLNGWLGISPIAYARETIGLTLAAERHGAVLFANAARPGGVLEYSDGALDEDAKKNLIEGWQSAYSGENAGKTALLEYGIKFNPVTMTSEDAQWLESRRFQIAEIARIFRMPLHKIQEMSQATYSNIEHQAIEFVVDTMMPWIRRWEQAISRCLLTPDERKTYYAEFLVDGLLRGDAKSRNEAYDIMRRNGILNADEWRAKESMNPLPDGKGQGYWRPVNMDESGAENSGESGREPGKAGSKAASVYVRSLTPLRRRSVDERRRLRNIYYPKFKEKAERLVKFETSAVRETLNSITTGWDPAALETWLTAFYESLPQAARSEFLGLLLTYAEDVQRAVTPETGIEPEMTPEMERFAADYLQSFAGRHAGSSQGQLRQLIREAEADQIAETVSARLDEWEQTRPHKVASREVVEAESAVTKKVYLLAGVTKLVWVAHGNSCPFCRRLDGRIIEIMGNFAEDGDEIPGGDGNSMRIRGAKSHPPLHQGCDCTISIGF